MTKIQNKRFYCKGLSKRGQKIIEVIEAPSMAVAKLKLHRQGIRITKIAEQKSLFAMFKKKIKHTDISLFSHQLATMFSVGIPLLQSFDIISKGNKQLRALIAVIRLDVETGLSLSEALRKHPSCFNALYCNLVHIGEQTGSLDEILHQIAIYKEKMGQIKNRLKKALSYPIAVLVISLMVTLGLLIVVIPQFEILFTGFGAQLPLITRIVVNVSKFFQSFGHLLFVFGVINLYLIMKIKKKSLMFRQAIDKFLLKLPIFGNLLKNSIIARFARTLAITSSAGLPLIEALSSVAAAVEHSSYLKAILQIRQEVSIGTHIHMALIKTKLFPDLVIQMIQVGEESGSLDKMLFKIAEFYEAEVDDVIEVLGSLIEPLIMVILGLLIAILVIAMYLPIFKLGSVI